MKTLLLANNLILKRAHKKEKWNKKILNCGKGNRQLREAWNLAFLETLLSITTL